MQIVHISRLSNDDPFETKRFHKTVGRYLDRAVTKRLSYRDFEFVGGANSQLIFPPSTSLINKYRQK